MVRKIAFVIGINKYKAPALRSLKYAKKDAKLISEFLRDEAGFTEIFLFSGDSPEVDGYSTRPESYALRRFFRDRLEHEFLGSQDHLWFFFSGHGIRHQQQEYLLPEDGDPAEPESNGILLNWITGRLSRSGAGTIVLILDACRYEGRIGEKGSAGFGEDVPKGIVTLFSCKAEESSWEIGKPIYQGAFTYALLEILRSQIPNPYLTIEEMEQRLQQRVAELNHQYKKRLQTPQIKGDSISIGKQILLPSNVFQPSITQLKAKASAAQNENNLALAHQLWTQVLDATAGQDKDAIKALEMIDAKRQEWIESQADSPTENSKFSKAPVNPTISSKRNTSSRSISTTPPSPSSPHRPASHSASTSRLPPFKRRIITEVQPTPPIRPQTFRSPTSSVVRPSRQITRRVFLGLLGLTAIAGGSAVTPFFSSYFKYKQLEEFLKAGKWKEADQETASLMIQAANQSEKNFIDSNSVDNIPCDVLNEIDRLWIEYSQGRFGFSIQKRIYVNECKGMLNGQYDEKAWDCFESTVGWKVNNEWIGYGNVTFNLSAPRGHLPITRGWIGGASVLWVGGRVGGFALMQKSSGCNF